MPTLVHFDIPAGNMGRAKKFYESLLGWKFSPMAGGIPYLLIETKDVKGKKGVGGGMGQNTERKQILTYFDVKNIEESMSMVVKLGGKASAKMPIPGTGYSADCVDSEGNMFGLFQADSTVKMPEMPGK